MKQKPTILIASLNWGLGHATRCIPIIKALEAKNFTVVIASDGDSLQLLKKEFPHLKTYVLPSYNITYPKTGNLFAWHFVKKIPHFIKTCKAEKKVINNLVASKEINFIISDNCFGVYHKDIPSIYISHQLRVLSGVFSGISTYFHQKIIENFNECWIPDVSGKDNFSGMLSSAKTKIPVKNLGILSRFKKENLSYKYDICVLLSGPEPQRSYLEKILITNLKNTRYKVILIQGKVEKKQECFRFENIEKVNFMMSKSLEKTLNQSKLVIARSGYSTIMDLAVLNKKAFFIPTPGQFEQEYLAKRMRRLKIAPFCKQKDFLIEKLHEVEDYSGFKEVDLNTNWEDLFGFFEGK